MNSNATNQQYGEPLQRGILLSLRDKAKGLYYQQRSKKLYAERIRPTIDLEKFNRLRVKWVSDVNAPRAGYNKYFAFEDYCLRDIRRALWLDLLGKSAKRSILDIGCGMGYFLYVSRQFGHSVTGLDLDGACPQSGSFGDRFWNGLAAVHGSVTLGGMILVLRAGSAGPAPVVETPLL